MKIAFSIFLGAIIPVLHTVAQAKKGEDKDIEQRIERWYEGSVMLKDGKELKGSIYYNDQTAVVSITDGTNSRALNARSVAGFEFFDESSGKQRVFYTFDTDDQVSSVVRPHFFEVLKEFKNFAVLSKVDPLSVEKGNTAFLSGAGTVGRTYDILIQTETIYLMNQKGELEPYMQVIAREDMISDWERVLSGDWWRRKDRTKILDEDLLARYVTEPVYEQLKTYAKQNDLKFRRKSHLLKIFDYYQQNFASR